MSLPDHVGQLPVYYNAKDSYRAGTYYNGSCPRYGFGFGLSYTSFSWEGLENPSADRPALTFRVRNAGKRPGWVVPQLYLHRTQGVVTSRVRQLCGFRKVYLQPGEETVVTIPIPEESLCQWDLGMVRRKAPGNIEWYLRDCGETWLEGSFSV